MKKAFIISFLLMFFCFRLIAQDVGIGTTTPNAAALLHLDIGNNTVKGLLVTGTYTGGSTVPDLNAGCRMMFYTGKAAFRVGYCSNTQWNNANVGDYSTAIGYSSRATGTYSMCLGTNTWASGQLSTTMGDGTIASGGTSTAMGTNTTASGLTSTAMGQGTTAFGSYSTAIGFNTTANGAASLSMGNGSSTTVAGTNSFAGGVNCLAGAANAVALGNGTTANGSASLAIGSGSNTTVAGINSFAGGLNSQASAANAVALGNATIANGAGAVAMGTNTTASGITSVAMGASTIASGNSSFAVGNGTNAIGNYSFAVGNVTTASGDYSFAAGKSVSTNGHQGSFFLGDSDPNNKGLRFVSVNDQFVTRFNGGYYLISSNFGADVGVQVLPGGNSWTTASDVRLKENFLPVNGEAFLRNIAGMNLTTWNYKTQNPATFRHYGPMAQDFYAAFGKDGLGTIGCDTLINQQDFLGINLIAIQALVKRTDELNGENAVLKSELRELKARMEKLENHIAK